MPATLSGRRLLHAAEVALALFTAALASTHSAAQLPPKTATAWEDVTGRWRASLAQDGLVGASLGLVTTAGLDRIATFGMAELPGAGEAERVDSATIYHWASITKTFTAISIMQLRDRGLIDLDDPIVTYVPELRSVHTSYGTMNDVTIRHLLSHSAGFRGGTWPWGGNEPWHPHEPTEWSQLVSMMPYTRLHFAPGTEFNYSNPGIIFLGRVIEAVTGDVFEAYVDKNIFRPLGMRRAYFDGTPWHLQAHRSNHYWIGENGPRAGGRDFNTGITVSNGGLNAPLDDMARYVSFLLGGSPGSSAPGEVLARASLEEMWRTVVPIGEGELGAESMGLSFFLYDGPRGRLVGHTGTQLAYYSFMIFDPAAGVGVIGAFNSVGVDGHPPATADLRTQTRLDAVSTIFPTFSRNR